MLVRKRLIIVAVASLLLLTGCAGGVQLSDEQNKIVAEYAADILAKRSYVYLSKYVDLKERYTIENTTPTEETTTESTLQTTTNSSDIDTPTKRPTSGDDPSTEPTTEDPNSVFDLVKVFGLNKVLIEYKDYKVVSEYPDDPDALFSFEPEEGYKLIVLEFDMYNNSDDAIVVNTKSSNKIFKARIDNKSCNNYANLMFNDISNLENVKIESHEHYNAVLFFMVEDEIIDEMKSFKVTVKDGEDNVRTLNIK